MRIKLYIAFLATFIAIGIQAQTKVKVLTRITEKSYEFDREFLLDIDAEKADILIESYDGNTVELTLKQIVKNQNQTIAEKHLKAQKFVDNASRERLYLKNYILFKDKNDQSGSIFKNEYLIKVPRWCHVRVKNSLGNLFLNSMQKSIHLDLEYAKAEINNCTSMIEARVNLGELNITNGTITGSIKTNNTRIKLQSVTGEISGETSFGTLSMFLNGNPFLTDIETNYCETTIINKSEGSYAFQLETKGGSINAVEYSPAETQDGEELIIKPQSEGVLPLIKIRATENDINLY